MSTTAELCRAAAGRAARALRRLGASPLMSLSPTTGPRWKPESRGLADAHAVLQPTEVNLLGPAQDREGQRVGLGVGGSEHVGRANKQTAEMVALTWHHRDDGRDVTCGSLFI